MTRNGTSGRNPLASRTGLSIRSRTIIGYVAIAALTILAASLAYVHMRSTEKSSVAIAEGMQWMEQLSQLRESWTSMMAEIDLMLLTRQSSMSGESMANAVEAVHNRMSSMAALSSTTGIEYDFSTMEMLLERADSTVCRICSEVQEGHWATARRIHHTELAAAERMIGEELDRIRAETSAQVAAETERTSASQRITRNWLVVMVSLILLFSPVAAVIASRSIVRPIEYLAGAVRAQNPEGLSQKLEVQRRDEMGELARAYNSMTDRLQMVMNGLEAQLEELQNMQQALTNSEYRYRSLFKHSPISLWQLFLSHSADPFDYYCELEESALTDIRGLIKVIDVNSATLNLLGASDREQLGTIDDILTDDSMGKFREAICALASGAGSYSAETTIRTVKGQEKYVLAHFAVPPDSEQGFRKVFLSLLDMTERKEMEKALKESEEQYYHAQKMEAVGRLTGGIAHDFNNLLTVIMSNCDIALMTQNLKDDTRGYLQNIAKAALRASSVTQQLMAFSRQQVSNPVSVNLNDLVTDISEMIRRLITENIHFTLKLEPDIPPVIIDAGQMEQVVMNLVVNARDAMPEGGDLTISTARKELSREDTAGKEATSGEYVTLTVTDSGHGMSREVQEKAFDPFYTTKELGKGTGLGLASAHGIVRNAGGWFHLWSEPEKGTSITVFLPAGYDGRQPGRESGELKAGGKGSETVLLIEDEEGVRDIASRALKRKGYTVIEAENGLEAFRRYSEVQGDIDLIVSDVILTGKMNGIEIARRIREKDPEIRVLLMSGYVQEAFAKSGDLPEGTLFIAKPFSLNDFLAMVRDTLDS